MLLFSFQQRSEEPESKDPLHLDLQNLSEDWKIQRFPFCKSRNPAPCSALCEQKEYANLQDNSHNKLLSVLSLNNFFSKQNKIKIQGAGIKFHFS